VLGAGGLADPGGDLTYLCNLPWGPNQYAGSSNDFVGSSTVRQRGVQRTAALSNGYIVDGLETNDPLTNLNSGLNNLVLD